MPAEPHSALSRPAPLEETEAVFFGPAGLDRAAAERTLDEALQGADDGELYLQYAVSEGLTLDDGRLAGATYDISQGFGLRAVSGEATGYAHAASLDEPALRRAAEAVRAISSGRSGALALPPAAANRRLYGPENPLDAPDFARKAALLARIDAYARAADPRVVQVTASLAGSWQAVRIQRAGGEAAADIRPLVVVRVQIAVRAPDGRVETGSHGCGGRVGFGDFLEEAVWKAQVDEALRQALVKIDAVPAPAGEMTVVLGPGWPGVLLHEAVGHGLEGDFNRKGTSAFAGLIGERVAAPGVTVVDDGGLEDRRGSLTVDDEGTPTARNVLIEDGILKGFLQDRLNARLMGVTPTGNGRRESFAHAPMPRMTNTFMLAGDREPEEVIASVDRGLYAVQFGGGQVDVTNGKFVFNATEAYLIENGKVAAPVRGAMLIGNGPDALTRVAMIGNDLALDDGIGMCGKDGQSVPVGVGQPTLRIDAMTVGGMAG